MPALDIFSNDAFAMTSLTKAINDLPPLNTKIGDMGLFDKFGLRTTELWLERRHGDLALVQTRPRGAPAEQVQGNKRDALNFKVPHISLESTIYADEVQDVRAFGRPDELQSVQEVVADRMRKMKRQVEATIEHMRIGALGGQILDADGSTLYDLATLFGVAVGSGQLTLSADSTAVRTEVLAIVRDIEDALGVQEHTGIKAICGSGFFDALVSHADVKQAYARYQNGEMLRNDPRAGFLFAGAEFIEYRAKAGTTQFLGDDECLAFPTGSDLFLERYAPADFLDTANDIGAPVYARLAPDPEFNRFVTLHVQSNPLPLVARPSVVVNVTKA